MTAEKRGPARDCSRVTATESTRKLFGRTFVNLKDAKLLHRVAEGDQVFPGRVGRGVAPGGKEEPSLVA